MDSELPIVLAQRYILASLSGRADLCRINGLERLASLLRLGTRA